MKITVCIGSSCHLKGSRQIIEKLQILIDKNDLGRCIELKGMFCMGRCQNDVAVMIDNAFFSMTPEKVETFFNEEILLKLL